MYSFTAGRVERQLSLCKMVFHFTYKNSRFQEKIQATPGHIQRFGWAPMPSAHCKNWVKFGVNRISCNGSLWHHTFFLPDLQTSFEFFCQLWDNCLWSHAHGCFGEVFETQALSLSNYVHPGFLRAGLCGSEERHPQWLHLLTLA